LIPELVSDQELDSMRDVRGRPVQQARRLRVAHVITGLQLGGGGAVVLTIARALDRSRFDMDVFCIHEAGEIQGELTRLGIRVKLLKIWDYRRRFLQYSGVKTLRLAARLREGRYDVVHTHIFQADAAGRVAARVAGVPVVVKSLHNMGRWKKPYQVAVDRLLGEWTDAVVCCSEYQREVASAQEHFSDGKAVTIHHGVDVRLFPARVDRASLRTSLGLKPGWTTVGTVGRTVEEKGHAYLLEAVPQILRVHPRVQFLIVGDGPLRQKLEARLAGTPHREHVCFAGARLDIPEMLAVMDVFAFPSLSEGFGIAVIEAMASSLPVVASRIRPLTEIVIEGQTGVLVPPDDAAALGSALNHLIAHPEVAASLGRRGRQIVEQQFTDRMMVRAHEDLYLRLHQAAVARGKAEPLSVYVTS